MNQLRSMKLYDQFGRDTDDKKQVSRWFRNINLKRETESLVSAAQKQALNTNSLEKFIIGMSQLSADHVEHMWRMFCTW